jgi:photosystem II stability/assembly factor-like uncharacterized protein
LFPLLLTASPGLGYCQARPKAVSLIALDDGKAAVHGVHILALAASPDGTLYAGGRDTYDPRTPNQPDSVGLGSVFLISHDHGAHWSKHVSEEPPPGFVAHYPPWTDHTRWPSNFTVFQLVVDPRHPSTIYAAGGLPVSTGSRGRPYLLLRSINGGRTWAELLVHNVTLATTPQLATNIVVTSANRQDLIYRHVYNAQALVIDPHDSRHLYIGTDALGVLRSTDGGMTWQYNAASPSVTVHTAEHLVIDPRHSTTVYALIQDTTVAFLYRSDNGGVTWHQVWHGGFASTITVEGRTLYLARGDGIYASIDRGLHWQMAVNPRTIPGFAVKMPFGVAGMLLQAVPESSVKAWDIAAIINGRTTIDQGIYVTQDAGVTWQRLADGRSSAPGSLSLALRDMEEGYTRVWRDRDAPNHILFASASLEGLYRWSNAP